MPPWRRRSRSCTRATPTNTTPSWERAHPNRYIIHNGEINTLRGNVSWIRAREPNLYSPVLQHDLERVLPIINREGSDSAILDNVLEFLTMNGRPLDRAVTLMIPEPWDHNPNLSGKRRAYDAYQSMLMEPWDGPAAIAFTDGRILGAALDRNGLRPARYYVTRDDRLILSSEVGTIDVEPENILRTGCLGPGEMLEVDPAQGRVLWNDEIRDKYANEKPYRDWLGDETLDIRDLREPEASELPAEPDEGLSLTQRLRPATATTTMTLTRPCAPWPPRRRCRWPPWASTRRLPCSPRRRAASLTTSTSCSPR